MIKLVSHPRLENGYRIRRDHFPEFMSRKSTKRDGERAEQRRALDLDRKLRFERQCQLRVELAQPRFLREAGRPGMPGRGRCGRFGLRFGHGFGACEFQEPHYRLIR